MREPISSCAGSDDLVQDVAKQALLQTHGNLLRLREQIDYQLQTVEVALAAIDGEEQARPAPRLFTISDCAKAESATKLAISKRLHRLPPDLKAKKVLKSGQNFLPEDVARAVVLTPEGARALARTALEREMSQRS